MRPPIVELFETFQPVQHSRVIVAHARLFGIAVGNSLVTLDNGFNRGLALGGQMRESCAHGNHLRVCPFKLRRTLGMRCGRAFTFARQSFCLLRQLLQSAVKLPREFL